jgi:hypothetical protein
VVLHIGAYNASLGRLDLLDGENVTVQVVE